MRTFCRIRFASVLFTLAAVVFFSSCKANMEAYKQAYQRIKEKEDAQVNQRAKTTTQVSITNRNGDSIVVMRSETLTLLAGDEKTFQEFNVVAKSFINRTNAKGYFGRMQEEGFPALLVQNQDQLYRIIVGSYDSADKATLRQTELKAQFPDCMVVVRLK